MGAVFNLFEVNKGSETTTATNINLGSTNTSNLNPALYPISAGTNSFEKYIMCGFAGDFNSISHIKFWKDSGDYVTGEEIKYGVTPDFGKPTRTTSEIATLDLEEEEPVNVNVTIGGSLNVALTELGYSDYIVIQSQISNLAPSGPTHQKVFRFSWHEN